MCCSCNFTLILKIPRPCVYLAYTRWLRGFCMEWRAWREIMNENQKRLIGAGLIVGVIILCIYAWLASAGRNDVSDNRKRADETRYELRNAESSQSRTAESLDRASDLAESAERDNQETGQRIEKIEEGNRNLQDSERGDAEIITESQSILDRVRARGKKEN